MVVVAVKKGVITPEQYQEITGTIECENYRLRAAFVLGVVWSVEYGGGNMSEQEVARLQEQIKTLFSDVDELCGGRLRTHRR